MQDILYGLFVVTEGIDGSGTSTQVHELIKKIEDLDKYQDVLRTHEPWRNKEIKRKLQEDKDAYSEPEEMAQLYTGDRTEHSYDLIKPNLNAGAIVICSRYKMSTCAFQQAQGVPLDKLLTMHEHRGILKPDITFFLDIDKEVAEERKRKRGIASEKFEKDRGFIDKVIINYKELEKIAEKDKNLFGRVIRIDANKSIEDVSEQIYEVFLPIYEEWKGITFRWSGFLPHNN